MRFRDYLTEEKPTKQQKSALDKMIRNTKEKVVTSFMKGKNMFVQTEKDEYNITPDGKVKGGAFSYGNQKYSGQ